MLIRPSIACVMGKPNYVYLQFTITGTYPPFVSHGEKKYIVQLLQMPILFLIQYCSVIHSTNSTHSTFDESTTSMMLVVVVASGTPESGETPWEIVK